MRIHRLPMLQSTNDRHQPATCNTKTRSPYTKKLMQERRSVVVFKQCHNDTLDQPYWKDAKTCENAPNAYITRCSGGKPCPPDRTRVEDKSRHKTQIIGVYRHETAQSTTTLRYCCKPRRLSPRSSVLKVLLLFELLHVAMGTQSARA